MELLPFAQVYFLYHKIDSLNFLFSIMLAVDCGSLEDPLDGHVDTTKGTLFTNMSVYSCNLEHHLFGCSVVECQANGTWSCDPPHCAGEFHRRFPLCMYNTVCPLYSNDPAQIWSHESLCGLECKIIANVGGRLYYDVHILDVHVHMYRSHTFN